MRYVFAECVLDTQLYSLYRAGTTVQLRPKAFQSCSISLSIATM